MFLTIDNWLFDKVFQPFTDWFCDKTGRSPMWLACTCGYIIGLVTILKITFLPRGWFTILDIGFFIYTFLVFYGLEKRNPVMKAGTMNTRRYGPTHLVIRQTLAVLTIMMFVLILLDLTFALLFCQCMAFTCSLYFGACEQKPSAPSKEKESPTNS